MMAPKRKRDEALGAFAGLQGSRRSGKHIFAHISHRAHSIGASKIWPSVARKISSIAATVMLVTCAPKHAWSPAALYIYTYVGMHPLHGRDR